MAPKRCARGAAGVSATRDTAGRGRRSRGARVPRAARARRGHGGSTGSIPSEAADTGALAHDFVLYIRGLFSRPTALPSSFAAVVSEWGLPGLWLHAQGYPCCPLWVMLHIEGSALVFLEDGWVAFARQFNLRKGDNLCWRFDGEDNLSIRAFDADGNRLEPCWESSSDGVSGGSDDT